MVGYSREYVTGILMPKRTAYSGARGGNKRKKGEGDYASCLTEMFRMQQETCIENLSNSKKDKNIGIVGESAADPGRQRQTLFVNN